MRDSIELLLPSDSRGIWELLLPSSESQGFWELLLPSDSQEFKNCCSLLSQKHSQMTRVIPTFAGEPGRAVCSLFKFFCTSMSSDDMSLLFISMLLQVHDSIKYLKPFWQASGNQSKLWTFQTQPEIQTQPEFQNTYLLNELFYQLV